MFGPQDLLDRIAQWMVGLVALFCLVNGAMMLVDPLGWYFSLPTVIATGPANSHFIRDIGAAYILSAAILGFAAVNLRMRWLAALAGSGWLILHALVHVFEVSTGICSPSDFAKDVPGVLGPPLLVLIALAILFIRQRVAVAGIPRALFAKAMRDFDDAEAGGGEGGEADFINAIAAAPAKTLERYKHFLPLAGHRGNVPAGIHHAARIGAVLVEDCGPCAITAAKGALVDGVDRDTLNLLLAGTPPEGPLTAAFNFGRAVSANAPEANELGDAIAAEHGEEARLELAINVAAVRVFPAMKRGLGLGKSCAIHPPKL